MKRCLLLTSLFVILMLVLTGCTLQGPLTTQTAGQPIQVPAAVSGLEQLLESIYDSNTQSVVNINVIENTPVLPPINGTTPQSPFAAALGSGFIWDTAGHIVTNNHVIENSTRITVLLYDGTTIEASLVGADPDSDLAVIKIEPGSLELKPVTLGDSNNLKVGQLAVAIGNPFGLQNTMTVGFISGLGRALPVDRALTGPNYNIPDIIQTDAPINPGNSGGVLLDDTGRVIGVTSAIATDSGSSAGVGFAIPSAIVQKVVPSLIASGTYQHPWIGVSILTLNPDLAKAMNLDPNQRGALVESVLPDSPADEAGIIGSEEQTTINGRLYGIGGDIILAFNGQTVKSSEDVIAFLARSGVVGQTVTLTILRNGQTIQVPVTLRARPNS